MSSKPETSDILDQAAEFGIKRICQSCGGKYYDLNKLPIVCPNCDTEWDPEATLSRRRSRITDEAKPKPEAETDEDETDENAEAGESEEDLVKDIPDVDVEEDDDFEQADDATLLEEDDDDSPILPEVVIESDDEKSDG